MVDVVGKRERLLPTPDPKLGEVDEPVDMLLVVADSSDEDGMTSGDQEVVGVICWSLHSFSRDSETLLLLLSCSTGIFCWLESEDDCCCCCSSYVSGGTWVKAIST